MELCLQKDVCLAFSLILVCLLEQPFVKDPDISVKKMLNGKCDVVRFVRFERGEGIEKRVNDLAADIAAEQAKMKK